MQLPQNQFALTDVSDQEFRGLIYTVMFDEIQRLRVTYRSRQRQQIRQFILSCCKSYLQSYAPAANQEISLQKMQQQHLITMKAKKK